MQENLLKNLYGKFYYEKEVTAQMNNKYHCITTLKVELGKKHCTTTLKVG